MAVLLPFRCGQFTLNTSGATQDFTLSDETRTPVAAYFQWSGATSLATNQNHASACWGACDGTREWYGSVFSENAVAATDSYNLHNTDAVIVHLDGTGAITGQLSFNSFIAGGVTLDIDNIPDSAYIGQIWFFFDGSYRADTASTGSTVDVATSVTTTGVAPPTFLIVQEFGDSVFSSTTRANASVSLGFCADDGSSDLQAGGVWMDQDNKATTEAFVVTDNATASGFILAGTNCTVAYAFTASGFDATPKLQNQAHHIGYLAGDIPGLTPWAGHISFPTSAGSQNITDPGAERPVGLICNLVATSEALLTGAATEGFGCGMFDGLSQFSLDIQVDDARNAAVNNTLTRSYVSGTQMTDLHQPPTTTFLAGTWTGGHANGFTMNVTTNPAAVRLMPVLLWSPPEAVFAVDETEGITEQALALAGAATAETLGITEEIALHGMGLSEESMGLVETGLGAAYASLSESLGIVEEQNPLGGFAIDETEGLLEEVDSFMAFAPEPSSPAGQAGNTGLQAGEGGNTGVEVGSG